MTALRVVMGAVLASLVLWWCDVRPGDLPEPPPPEYAGKGPAPGTTVTELPSLEEISRACQQWGVQPHEAYSLLRAGRNRGFAGCYIPAIQAEIVPAPGVVPEDRRQAIIDHEDAHSWGLVHDGNGRGWVMLRPAANLFAARPSDPVNLFRSR